MQLREIVLVIGVIKMETKKQETFKEHLSSIKNRRTAVTRIVCTAEQRTNLEKYLMVLVNFPFVDKRKYATSYHLPTGSKIVIIHERLVTPLFKSKIDFDVRKWTPEQLSKFFKLK